MVLDKIVAAKKEFVRSLGTKDFLAELKQPGLRVIAELKSKSPSEGVIKADYDPVAIAKEYVQGGAAAISVLCDEPFFGGSFGHLQAVRAAVDVPLLCKDFIIDAQQIYHARAHGADAVLLIVRILDQAQLAHLKQMIESLNMLAVVEIFDEADLQRALAVNPKVLLVNNRNLDSLVMNMNNTASLLDLIPEDITVIAASGMKVPSDVQNFPPRVQAVLVGTMLMRSNDPAELITEIIACRA